MSQISRVLRDHEDCLTFWCPGCKCGHALPIIGRITTATKRDKWTWNGDLERPVFHPSVHCKIPPHKIDGVSYPGESLCHSWVGKNGAKPGQIAFLGDCKHALRGQVVDLPDWPNWEERQADDRAARGDA